MSTLGIEEEFFLLHPETGLPAVSDPDTSAELLALNAAGNSSQQELQGTCTLASTPRQIARRLGNGVDSTGAGCGHRT